MVEVELTERELSILVNMLQMQQAVGTEELVLLRKLGDSYKAIVTLSVPPE